VVERFSGVRPNEAPDDLVPYLLLPSGDAKLTQYVVLVRALNVGTYARLKMSELRSILLRAGCRQVRTYIQSGNLVLRSGSDRSDLEDMIASAIEDRLGPKVGVAAFTAEEWRAIMASAPDGWGEDPGAKHNLIAILSSAEDEELSPFIGSFADETVVRGDGVLYHSIRNEAPDFPVLRGLTTGRNAKAVSVRTARTARKLLEMLET
jgi:uncharacterized protein (DUF1697 family)